ncbi:class I SAM-dependent methyltransferase [Dactylosporangium sp. CA-092794]|uniref:class I SAM-dependent methyltransferase n=1 Tax=Dactylosporangium sp. CA-092794 TaxID=3239929 RepID=UPI003D8BF3E0
MRTYPESFWADLYTSFPLLADELGDRDLAGTTACVLGCSDGKFVIPLAGAGCQVTCVDVDPIMLDGGEIRYRGETVTLRGLRSNLDRTGLLDRCELIETDFMRWRTDRTFDFVLTSGSWAYNRNLEHGLSGVLAVMQRLVASGGYLFADYLLPVTEMERGIDLYPQPEDLQPFFPEPPWRLIHNEGVGLIGESHYGQEEWHHHNYGALLAQRVA